MGERVLAPGVTLSAEGVIHTLANQREQYPSAARLKVLVDWAMEAHGNWFKEGKEFRKFDGRTPIIVHPLDCMTEISQEPNLSEGDRAVGAQALLLHDVIEDTRRVPEPGFVSERVLQLVGAMTFPGGTAEERAKIFTPDVEPFVRLLKLYDKFGNAKALGWMTAEKRVAYLEYLGQLRGYVVSVYGPDLNIVKLAGAFLPAP